MSLSRKLLESLGIESDKISTIIEAHAETVDGLKEQIATYKGDAEKYKGASAELEAVKAELEGLKAEGGDWKSKFDKVNSDFEEYKSQQSAKELMETKKSAYRKLLKDSGVSEKRIDTVMKVTDFSDLELEESGEIKGASNLAESIKAEWADFIVDTSKSGAKVDTPPDNNPQTKYTHEEIAKMSADEINANWDSIKNSMK